VAISLDTTATSGNLTLSRNNIKIKVFTAADGGSEIGFDGTDNVFAASDLPKNLYVEGAEASVNMRDVSLTLTHDETSESDEVRFTVLWVTVTSRHSGNVSNDYSARAKYEEIGVPPSVALGYRLCAVSGSVQVAWTSICSEFIGNVAPSDFKPSDFGGTLFLDRELINGKSWWGPEGKEFSADETPRADTSHEEYRDDDPQSGGSAGKICDTDCPGVNATLRYIPAIIQRFRVNFKAWAVYGTVRCSSKLAWYTRQSSKLTGDMDTGKTESGTANTLTDTDKSWTGDMWKPGVIRLHIGTGSLQIRRITGNTGTTITVATNWSTNPDATTEYRLINSSSWTAENGVANDNRNGDGTTTNISWDLT
jgi:hypothetical protein